MTCDAESIVSLEVSEEEALVLFEWLHILENKRDLQAGAFTAEEIVLLRIQAQLESRLVAPFQDNYRELLKAAKEAVVASAQS